MFARIDQLTAGFVDQFEPDGADFIYRASQKGAPVRVTAAERDGFVADFRRWYRWGFAGLFLGMLAGAVVATVAAFQLGEDYSTPILLGWIAVTVGIYGLLFFRAWRAPARALARRPVLGAARSPDEMRKIKLGAISYAQLALIVPVTLLYVWSQSARTDLWHGWGRLWLVGAAGFVGLAAVQALRKWRMEREG